MASVEGEEARGLVPASSSMQRSPAPAAAAAPEPDPKIDIADVVHAIESFNAVVKPVAVVMLLVSWAVINVRRTGPGSSSKLLVFDESQDVGSGASTSTLIGHALVNSLAIICVFGATTMIVVGAYKFRCISCMTGYMMFSTALLLGLMGGLFFQQFCRVYNLRVSLVSLVVLGWNWVAVGLTAIFYQKGVPNSTAQFYLAASSGIMAWQLSTKLPEWTSWTLLVMLACYDLFAVLSPSGPLRMMVELMVEQQSFLPGMLYEADINYSLAPDAQPAQTEMQELQLASPSYHDPHGLAFATSPGAAAALAARSHMEQQQQRARRTVEQRVSVRWGHATGGLSGTQDFLSKAAQGVHQDSVKLGLGDFIFYSMLVAKAGLFDFTTLGACFLVILVGLSATLLVVSIFRKAIPALPVSIGLGVTFYLLTRCIILPFVQDFFAHGVTI